MQIIKKSSSQEIVFTFNNIIGRQGRMSDL